jgi:hypothetical protein
MEFRNFTPFPSLQFESRDEKKRDFGVAVLRGTFDIVPDRPLAPAEDQAPLVMADVYHGEPGRSSLKLENNIAPYKPKTDIHLEAEAHAPSGRPEKTWRVGLKVGRINKQLLVTGPRFWRHHFVRGWRITAPLPCVKAPVRYENAFGGVLGEADHMHVCEENMVGSGFGPLSMFDTSRVIAAPQIMSPDKPVMKLGGAYRPDGLGPIAPGWSPRCRYGGTMDDRWRKTRWPDLPEDFRFDFYNSAHPDLIYPGFVQGDEEVVLFRLSPIPELRFTLPGLICGLLVRWEDGQMVPLPMQLDTVHMEVPAMKVFLVWRGVYPLGKPIRVLEARMKQPDRRGGSRG